MEESPEKKFDLPSDFTSVKEAVHEISLQDLDNSAIDEHVNVTIKVINVHPIETLVSKSGKHLAKQECIVADSTATARMVLWENNIGRLSLNCSYKLEDVLIRAFQNIKYLSII